MRRTAANGTVTRYLYDGDDLLMELDGRGNPIREYTYLPGVDRPHSVRVSATSASYYYVTDHPANVVGLLNKDGQVVNEYEYDPWGVATVLAEGVQQPLRYAAREWDATAGALPGARALVRPAHRAVRQRGSDRAGGRDQHVRVCAQQPSELY